MGVGSGLAALDGDAAVRIRAGHVCGEVQIEELVPERGTVRCVTRGVLDIYLLYLSYTFDQCVIWIVVVELTLLSSMACFRKTLSHLLENLSTSFRRVDWVRVDRIAWVLI